MDKSSTLRDGLKQKIAGVTMFDEGGPAMPATSVNVEKRSGALSSVLTEHAEQHAVEI